MCIRDSINAEYGVSVLYCAGIQKAMGGKAKPTKHTSAEIAKKNHLATTNMGGGKAGLKDRLGGAAGHAKFVCYACQTQVPDLKTMKIHFEAKHPSMEIDESKFVDAHEIHGGSTKGVGVRGGYAKKNHHD
eukprot:TRINITY_DN15040_c0_g1_i2.p1 TRINITY_DN15040_c0_g1~~TRINITY_DN15040_c0_g1_i2.p1  ORF type:complete len:131 (+),score=32.30 TRINITY_DN15040_c0_g1_i2:153-545(+)